MASSSTVPTTARSTGRLSARCCEGRATHSETTDSAGLVSVFADRSLLTVALMSIADNSIDAQPDGGSIYLEAGRVAGVGSIEFRISDAGPGFSETAGRRIFEPFFTTKGGGTGLGLAIARNVVLGHSGRIQIGSRPGGGASVSIEIPTSAAT